MQLQVLLVHQYFGSKEELMVALIQQQAQQVLHLLFRDYPDWLEDLLQESRPKGLAKMNQEQLDQFMDAGMDRFFLYTMILTRSSVNLWP